MTDIATQIFSTPDGGPVALDGRALPDTGYYVGGKVSPLILGNGVDFTPDAHFEVETFINYLTNHRLDVEFVEWWTDEDDGKVYVDAVTWTPSYDYAERLCRERGEDAFEDIATGRWFSPVVQEVEL